MNPKASAVSNRYPTSSRASDRSGYPPGRPYQARAASGGRRVLPCPGGPEIEAESTVVAAPRQPRRAPAGSRRAPGNKHFVRLHAWHHRYFPVTLRGLALICRGVPSARTWPPLWPPSGPMSMIQSARLMISVLCSMMMTVLLLSTSFLIIR